MANIASDGIPEIQHFNTIHRLTAVHIIAVINTEGIQDIEALNNIYLKDVKRMNDNLSRLHINRGGAYIVTGATTNLMNLF